MITYEGINQVNTKTPAFIPASQIQGIPAGYPKRETAQALIGQGSDPDFLLGEEGGIFSLNPGDTVTMDNITGIIAEIDYEDNDLISIALEDGTKIVAGPGDIEVGVMIASSWHQSHRPVILYHETQYTVVSGFSGQGIGVMRFGHPRPGECQPGGSQAASPRHHGLYSTAWWQIGITDHIHRIKTGHSAPGQ